LWLALALLLLHLYSECKPLGAARCAQVAMALGRSMMDVSKVSLLFKYSCKNNASIDGVQACGPRHAEQRLVVHILVFNWKLARLDLSKLDDIF
jgi:hypothetical protein